MELDDAMRGRLHQAARAAAQTAYAPYSRFAVGAAVLTGAGTIHAACNVENASYGLCICAERAATFAAVGAGHREIRAVAIYTPTAQPTAPCGACRQVLLEFGPRARMLGFCDGALTLDMPLTELLPNAFGPADLGANRA